MKFKYNPLHTSKLGIIGDAEEIDFDNSATSLTSENVQDAIEEIANSGASNIYYEHTQTIAQSTWIIVHNLNKFPNITVVDNTNKVIEPGTITYTDSNTITLEFQVAGSAFDITGKAFIS